MACVIGNLPHQEPKKEAEIFQNKSYVDKKGIKLFHMLYAREL